MTFKSIVYEQIKLSLALDVQKFNTINVTLSINFKIYKKKNNCYILRSCIVVGAKGRKGVKTGS